MRRFANIFLLLGFLTFATGLLENLHLQSHLREHHSAKHSQEDSHHPTSGGDCLLCLQLHLPTMSAGWVPLLICLGLFVAFLTVLDPRLTPQRAAVGIDCRGPPFL